MIGRRRELDELVARIQSASAGRGTVTLVTGDAGLGKSLLVAEGERAARSLGVKALWGRSWEAGGAPAFWPWIQVVRDLVSSTAPEDTLRFLGRGAADVAELVPELEHVTGAAPGPVPLEPQQARFRQLDAVSRYLFSAAAAQPVLILLEDLHTADASSLALLDFIGRAIEPVPIAIVGTFREVDARTLGVAGALAKIGRAAHTIPLAPLVSSEIEELVRSLGVDTTRDRLATIAAKSEGNPLFAAEYARLIAGDGGSRSIPDGVSAVIEERLTRLPQATLEVLRSASVIGREFALQLVAAANATPKMLDPAIAAGLISVMGGQYRFTHILIREALVESLGAEERLALHLAYGQALAELHRGDPTAPLAEIAHHFGEAGIAGGEDGVMYAVRAADRAMSMLAYEEAAKLYEQALDRHNQIDPANANRRCGLLLSLARALLFAGRMERGKETCLSAAATARQLGSPELLARAALEYGATFTFAHVDPRLVELLGEALAATPDSDRAMRAKLLARRAAALQPALDPSGPVAMAREAIAISGGLDAATRLAVLRSACSAMVDYVHPNERLAINEEHLALATELGEPVEMIRATRRKIFDHLELGNVSEVDAEIELHARLSASLRHPSFEWQTLALRAMREAMRGRFESALALARQAGEIGERSGDPNASFSLRLQRIGFARVQFDDDRVLAALEDSPFDFSDPGDHGMFGAAVRGGLLSQLGYEEQAHEVARRMATKPFLSPDVGMLAFATDIATCAGEVEYGAKLLEIMLPFTDRLSSWGSSGLMAEGPVEGFAAMLEWLLGRKDEARARFERALARCRECGLAPAEARVLFEYGRRVSADGDRAHGDELLAQARDIATRLGMTGIVSRIEALGGVPQSVAARSTPRTVGCSREGDVWAITHDRGAAIRMKDSKGMQMLAQLLSEPRREFHVLDLMGSFEGVDGGDAGELIDDDARSRYRARVAELRDLIEATSDADRAEQAREELEFIARELSHGTGSGGRARRSGSSAERARTNVQKRIKAAIHQIGRHDRELAQYLDWTVKTGTFCSYEPR